MQNCVSISIIIVSFVGCKKLFRRIIQMKKIIKKIVKVLAFVLLAVVALMIIIPMFFSDKLLNYGCQLAKDYINADLYVKDLNMNLFKHFPDVTIRIDSVYLKGVDEFEHDTLAAFDRLEATVNLMSLFGGKIKVKQVDLQQPKFNIIVLKNGKPNYDIVKTDSASVEEQEVDTLPASSFKLALKKFEINNMRVLYTDSITDVHALIDSLNFKLTGDLSDKESILSMLMDIAKLNVRMGPIIYINDAVVDVKSDLDADMEQMKFSFRENVFKINQLALNLDGWIAVPDTNVRMDLKFGADNTDFKSVLSMIPADYAKDLEGVKTAGQFSFDGGAKGDFNAVSFPEFWVNLLIENARFQYPDLPKSVENINVDVRVKCPGNLDSINIDAKKVHMNIADNPIDARFLVQTSAKDIDLAGDVNASLELSSVADVVPLEDMTLKGLVKAILSFDGKLSYLDDGAYDKFNAKGDITLNNFRTVMTDLPPVDISKAHLIISPKKADLENLSMTMGKSDFNLNGKIDNIFHYVFADSTLKASFNFKSNLIDVNDFYSYDHSVVASDGVTDTSAVEAPEIPTNIDFALNSSIGKILYDSLVINNLTGMIGLKNGAAFLNDLKLNTLGGKVFASGVYDAADINRPGLDLQLDLSQVDIQTTAKTFNTVQQLAPIASSCQGNVTAKINFAGFTDRFLTPDLKTINGDGRLATNQVAIKNSNIFKMIGEVTKNEKLANPALKNINVGFKIIDGDVIVDTTGFKLNDQDATFGGKLGLDQSLNFDFGLTLVESMANELLGKVAGGDRSGMIKVVATLGGTVLSPKIVGFHTSATDVIKEVVQEKIQEAKEKLSENAKKYIAEAKKKADEVIAVAKHTRDTLINTAQKQCDKLKQQAKEVSDKAIAEASKQADALIAQATNPIAKAAAQRTADELKKKAKAEADKALNDAYAKADKVVSTAKAQGDKIVNTAEQQAEKINSEAMQKAESIK